MSLWQVGDEITAELMSSFYSAILKDASPAAALAQAQARLREMQPDCPFAWAAFVCQGAGP